MRPSLAPLAAGLAMTTLLSCSLGTYKYTPCTSNIECRDAFGFGSVCGVDGLCAQAPTNNRCTETYPADLMTRPGNYANTIIFGSLYDHSTDIPETLATALPIIQVNDYGGLDGHDFAMVECDYEANLAIDDQTNDEAAASGALYLADTIGVPAIIGPATSSQATTAYNALHTGGLDDDVVMISPSATSVSLTTIDGVNPTDDNPGLFWRTAPPDDLQGKVLGQLVTQAGFANVVCIHESGPYGQGLYEAFDANYSGTSTELSYSDQSAMISDVTSNTRGYDAVLFFSSETTDIAAFLNAATTLTYFGTMPIFFGDAARDTDLLNSAQGASALFPNITGTAPSIEYGDVYDAFDAAYSAQYAPSAASDSVYTPYCFDATWLGLFGSAWSWYQDAPLHGLGIARGLRHISDPAVSSANQTVLRPTNWAELVASAQAGVDVNIVGASGNLDYDPATGETSGPVDVWTITATGDGFTTTETCDAVTGTCKPASN